MFCAQSSQLAWPNHQILRSVCIFLYHALSVVSLGFFHFNYFFRSHIIQFLLYLLQSQTCLFSNYNKFGFHSCFFFFFCAMTPVIISLSKSTYRFIVFNRAVCSVSVFVSAYVLPAVVNQCLSVLLSPGRCSEEDPVSGGTAVWTGGRELFSRGHTHAL